MKIPHVFSLGLALSVFWLLLSGHYTRLLLALGLLSVFLVVYLANRMDVVDQEGHPVHLRLFRLIGYWIWLLGKIVMSSLDVCFRILDPKLPISPNIVKVPCGQTNDLGCVIYANSITLTPGTVSLSVDEDSIEIHALSRESAEELREGEMGRRIAELEG